MNKISETKMNVKLSSTYKIVSERKYKNYTKNKVIYPAQEILEISIKVLRN